MIRCEGEDRCRSGLPWLSGRDESPHRRRDHREGLGPAGGLRCGLGDSRLAAAAAIDAVDTIMDRRASTLRWRRRREACAGPGGHLRITRRLPSVPDRGPRVAGVRRAAGRPDDMPEGVAGGECAAAEDGPTLHPKSLRPLLGAEQPHHGVERASLPTATSAEIRPMAPRSNVSVAEEA